MSWRLLERKRNMRRYSPVLEPLILFARHAGILFGGLIVFSVLYATGVEYFLLYVGLMSLALAIYVGIGLFNRRLATAIYGLTILILAFVASVHADNYDAYGPLLQETGRAIFQSSIAEMLGYLSEFTSLETWLIVTGWLILSMLTLLMTEAISKGAARVLVSFFLVVGLGSTYLGRDTPLMLFEEASHYREVLRAFADSREFVLSGFGPVSSSFEGSIVLVLGESTARQHLGVYGYPRNTTPYLSSIAEELVIYRDIITTHSHTLQSLSDALTFSPRGAALSIDEVPDLISVFKRAGLETYWLSNQNAVGIWDSNVAAIAREADFTRYHDPSSGIQLKRSVFDESMIDTLDEVLKQRAGGKLIVINLMATHSPYCDVVPPSYEPRDLQYELLDVRFFGSLLLAYELEEPNRFEMIRYLANVNCYDRAVNYVDFVLEQIVARLRRESAPSVMLYVADHGEAPLLGSGHDSRSHSHFHVEVPYILWRNKAFVSDALSLLPERRGSLEDLSFHLAHLAGIEGIDDLDQRSIFAERYLESERRTLRGAVGYDVFDLDADAVERSNANLRRLPDPSRVWAHRINSGGSLLEAKEIFHGVEFDVVFDELTGQFKVYHPPADDVDLSLEMQLQQGHAAIRYWLDWKNASLDNVPLALKRLADLDERYHLKQRALIETGAVDGSASLLANAGWRVSYYLPTDIIANCWRTCSVAEKKSLGESLWSDWDDSGFTAVSFDVALLPFVEEIMLRRIKRDNIPAYTWAPSIDIADADAPEKLEPLLERSWIEVVLVTFPNPFRL